MIDGYRARQCDIIPYMSHVLCACGLDVQMSRHETSRQRDRRYHQTKRLSFTTRPTTGPRTDLSMHAAPRPALPLTLTAQKWMTYLGSSWLPVLKTSQSECGTHESPPPASLSPLVLPGRPIERITLPADCPLPLLGLPA